VLAKAVPARQQRAQQTTVVQIWSVRWRTAKILFSATPAIHAAREIFFHTTRRRASAASCHADVSAAAALRAAPIRCQRCRAFEARASRCFRYVPSAMASANASAKIHRRSCRHRPPPSPSPDSGYAVRGTRCACAAHAPSAPSIPEGGVMLRREREVRRHGRTFPAAMLFCPCRSPARSAAADTACTGTAMAPLPKQSPPPRAPPRAACSSSNIRHPMLPAVPLITITPDAFRH